MFDAKAIGFDPSGNHFLPLTQAVWQRCPNEGQVGLQH
jgi:hypothetical protein